MDVFKKVKKILDFTEAEANKPLVNHNYETRIWSKGYRHAMIETRNYIWRIFNKDN